MKMVQRLFPLFLAILVTLSCSQTEPRHTWLDFFLGRVEVLGAGGASKAAVIRMPLVREDTVRTHEKSMAFVQCGADNIIQIRENSEFSLAMLPDRMESSGAPTALRLLKGTAAFYVESLKKGGALK